MNRSSQSQSLSARSVVVTGATGLVGGQLLRRLLTRGTSSIVCIVRAKDAEDASRRGHTVLLELLGRRPTGDEASRVHWLCGDVEQDLLGLPSAVHSWLAGGTDEIYHCAGSTRLDLPLAEARRLHVRGASSVQRFAEKAARHGDFRRLHYLSSAHAAGIFRGVRGARTAGGHLRRYRNAYERSKAEAEQLLLRCSRVPVTIYRPSFIVGDRRAVQTTSRNVVHRLVQFLVERDFGRVPGSRNALLDFVPVDHVVDAMLALGARGDTLGQILHVTAGLHALSWPQVIERVRIAAGDPPAAAVRSRTRLIGRLRWSLGRLVDRGRPDRVAYGTGGAIESYLPYTRLRCVFDNERETRLLAADGLTLPRASEYFPSLIQIALARGLENRRAMRGDP